MLPYQNGFSFKYRLVHACIVCITSKKSIENTTWSELGNQKKNKQKKNAPSSLESHFLGESIRKEEAIRPRMVALLSSEPRAASGKVKLCSRPTVI